MLCISLLGDESLPSLSVVEDWDRDAPASLSGDAPVGPSVQHGQQAAMRRLWQNTHLLQRLLDKHTHTHTNSIAFLLETKCKCEASPLLKTQGWVLVRIWRYNMYHYTD